MQTWFIEDDATEHLKLCSITNTYTGHCSCTVLIIVVLEGRIEKLRFKLI